MPPRKRRTDEAPADAGAEQSDTRSAADVRRGSRPGLRLRRGDRRARFLPAVDRDTSEG